MTAQNLPEPLREYLDSECWAEEHLPRETWCSDPMPCWLARLLARANYTLISIAIALVLCVAAEIFVAFHSGRVRHVLDQAGPSPNVEVSQ